MLVDDDTIILGDIGSRLEVFEKILPKIEGRKVIQVGDMVRVRPYYIDSNKKLVEFMYEHLGDSNWVQVFGNHESSALGGPKANHWVIENCFYPETVKLLRKIWDYGDARIAIEIDNDDSPILLTHGGLSPITYDYFSFQGESVTKIAETLNNEIGTDFPRFDKSRAFTKEWDSEYVSPLWTEWSHEVYEGWEESGGSPFPQVHGHAAPYRFSVSEWWPYISDNVRSNTMLYANSWTNMSRTARYPIFSVDPQLGDKEYGDIFTNLELPTVRFIRELTSKWSRT